jgi:hypothetical protein
MYTSTTYATWGHRRIYSKSYVKELKAGLRDPGQTLVEEHGS